MSASLQWLTALAYTSLWFLLMMKVRLGNRALDWLGRRALSFYLMHGVFVELFGFDFQGVAKSLVYIRPVPLYILTVLACTVVSSVCFHWLWQKTLRLIPGTGGKKEPSGRIPPEG